MVNVSTPRLIKLQDKTDINRHFFAVYDSCVTNNIPSNDLAFIEERFGDNSVSDEPGQNEQYFSTLSEAKMYVNNHFNSGAEYFSCRQCLNPDNILFILLDKISYLMA